MNCVRLSQLAKLSFNRYIKREISTSNPLNFKTTPILLAEPLKKKKRLDPSIVKAREDRKKKKIEKQIRRLEKNARQLKPIEECEVSLQLLDEKKFRTRAQQSIQGQLIDQEIDIKKEWAFYKKQQHDKDERMLNSIINSQQRALEQLKIESDELYHKAVEVDLSLLPFRSEGPKDTPKIEAYEPPDGDYLDVSKKWE